MNTRRSLSKTLSLRALVAMPLFVMLCGALPTQYTPDDDAGDVAFVHQVVQALLGRKPRGAAEIQVLTTIAQTAQQGRAAVVDVLLREPEVIDYWTTVIADAMQVQREGDFKQNKACFDASLYLTNSTGVAEATLLADFIRDTIPATPMFDPDNNQVANPWNYRDAIKASILVDDLHVAWRPWLFALAGTHGNNASVIDIRDNFLSTTFNVRTECIGCHASSYSKTESYVQAPVGYEANYWDRTATTGFKTERAAFGVARNVNPAAGTWGPIFDSKCGWCHGSDGTWEPSHGGDLAPKMLVERVPLLTRQAIKDQIINGGGLMPPISTYGWVNVDNDASTSADDEAMLMAQFLRDQLGGWEDMDAYLDGAQFASATGARPWGMDTCAPPWTPVTTPIGDSAAFGGDLLSAPDVARLTYVLRNGLPTMLAETGAAAPTALADGHLAAPLNSHSAVAMLVAGNIVDDVYEEVFGARFSLQHGLVRNPDAATFKKAMIDALVVSDGPRTRLSLKNLFKQMMLSELFNRRSPSVMNPSPNNGYQAYQLPMLANPWAATAPALGVVDVKGAPSTTGNNLNGQGDFVHRRSPNQILWSLRSDLGWPSNKVYPSTTALDYPSHTFMTEIGRFASSRKPGTTVWQLDSLVIWEKQVGLCVNPDPTTTDWVKRAVNAAYTAPATTQLRTLVLGLKDRLIQEALFTVGTDGTSEEQLVIDLLNAQIPTHNVTTLSTTVGTWAQTDVETALRAYCGVLLLSPDYLIAGVPTVQGSVPPAPPTVLCLNAAEPCSVTALTSHYDQLLCDAGYHSALCP